MGKIALLADSHLVHKYHKEFNKITEFARLIDEVMENKPEAIIFLGDFFDKKASNQGRPITHPQGARQQFPLINIMKKTDIPWYLLTGNHDDKGVLKGIAQACEEACFLMATKPEKIKDVSTEFSEKPLTIGNLVFWFGDIDIDTIYKEKKNRLQSYMQANDQFDSKGKKNVLLLHLDFIRYGEGVGLDKDLIQSLSHNFDLIIDGHEHAYNSSVDSFNNVQIAPPCLPPWIVKGRGISITYKFENNKITRLIPKPKQPFGYFLLDDQTAKIKISYFQTSMPCVEVTYDVTGKELSDINDDWMLIAESLKKDAFFTEIITGIIIIPIFDGTLENIMKFDINHILDTVSNKHENIFIQEFRKTKDFKILSFNIDSLKSDDILNVDDVFDKTTLEAKDIQMDLKKKGINITQAQISEFINSIKQSDSEFFFEKKNKSIPVYMGELIETLLTNFDSILKEEFDIAKITILLRESGK